jgi:lipopolysaccharide export LptBFGC system permease protein LptF
MKQNRLLGKTGLIDNQANIDKIILNVAKQRKQIIYGARSIEKQARLLARDTKDYDIFDKQPKKSANLIQKRLDKNAGFDYYFTKEAEHKGTWKVKGRGVDNIRNTKDDESIVDYTKPTEKVKFIIRNGIRYRVLKDELRKKQAILKDPAFKFRYAKDKDDINRIKGFIKIRKLVGGGIG